MNIRPYVFRFSKVHTNFIVQPAQGESIALLIYNNNTLNSDNNNSNKNKLLAKVTFSKQKPQMLEPLSPGGALLI